ncbi:glycosyltransferase, partial [Patescibacteria group bacterium]|nr:glycosyltransferase [Patescibacteria group bacterium]
MIIGINASSALREKPTGVEEYTFQLIKHLAMIPESAEHRFVLYLNSRLKSERLSEIGDLPENFRLKYLSFPLFWTQLRLAAEMLESKIDVLFIPVHILPLIHPAKSVVVIHGLEYEFYPKMYPFLHRRYLRSSTRYALKNAAKIIAVSENTKNDLVNLYGGEPDKIRVVHHGINETQNSRRRTPDAELQTQNDRYVLYVGRLELKKNILGIIEAYNELRQKNPQISNKLVLTGGKGFGWEKITSVISASAFKNDIVLKGYVAESEKNDLLQNAAKIIAVSENTKNDLVNLYGGEPDKIRVVHH